MTTLDIERMAHGAPDLIGGSNELLTDKLVKAATPPEGYISSSHGTYLNQDIYTYGDNVQSIIDLQEAANKPRFEGVLFATNLHSSVQKEAIISVNCYPDDRPPYGLRSLFEIAKTEMYKRQKEFYEKLSELAGFEIEFNSEISLIGPKPDRNTTDEQCHLDPRRILDVDDLLTDKRAPSGVDRLPDLKMISAYPSTIVLAGGEKVNVDEYANMDALIPLEQRVQGIDATPIVFAGNLVPHGPPGYKSARVFSHAIGVHREQ